MTLPRSLLPSIVLAGLPLVLGCPPPETEDTGPEADTDADSDADADADGDMDTDADVDSPVWEGQITYQSTVDDELVCDAVVALMGSPFTGPCVSYKGDQCDFAYNIDATVVQDDSTAACPGLNPYFTYLESGFFAAPVLAYWDAYSYGGVDYYTHLMLTGYAVDYRSYGGGYYAGPYWAFLLYDGIGFGAADIDYPALVWDIDYVSYEYGYPYYQYCPGAVGSYATENLSGAWVGTEQLDTSASLNADVWSFTVSDTITDPLYITVDTVNAKTGCDMGAFLNKPDECSDVFAHGNAACTYPVSKGKYLCPAIDLDPAEPGTYELVVYVTGWYAPTAWADYQVRIDSSYDPQLELVGDDKTVFETVFLGKSHLLVSGWGQPIDD
jgi:hypothetical protein